MGLNESAWNKWEISWMMGHDNFTRKSKIINFSAWFTQMREVKGKGDGIYEHLFDFTLECEYGGLEREGPPLIVV